MDTHAPTKTKPSCTWLIQSTVRGATLERLEWACQSNGNPFHIISVIPFSEAMPDDMPPVEGPFVFFGYTTLMLNVYKDPRWRPGIFFDLNTFRPSVYLKNWGPGRMLNASCRFLTMHEFSHIAASSPAKSWFLKPDDDLKRFAGGVMTGEEYLEWYTAGIAALDGGEIGPETRIIVDEPKDIGNEWRVFVVGGRPITESCYTNNGKALALPPELKDFVVDAAEEWSPADAFAIDVTIDNNAEPKIIEANCINGSGLYLADTTSFVRALSVWQEAKWFS